MDWEEKNNYEPEGGMPDAVPELTEGGEEEGEELETPEQREAREKREEAERREKAKKRRLIPAIITLFAGAVVSIAMRILRYDTLTMLVILLCVLCGFYFVGRILQIMLDRFELQIEEARMMEGEVIEKEPEEEPA